MGSKRIFDFLVASAGILFLSPLFGVVALLIRLDSPGPVFYRSNRLGKDARVFRIFKFRTMVDRPQGMGPAVTYHNDPRITRIGRFLRKAKVDELPQLLNVVKGEMSLVGPRAEDPRYLPYYGTRYRKTLSVPPGMTALSWIKLGHLHEENMRPGPDWETHYVEVSLPRKLEVELDYVDSRSLCRDFCLILRTVGGLVKSFLPLGRGEKSTDCVKEWLGSPRPQVRKTLNKEIKRWIVRDWREGDQERILELINLVQPHVPFSEERWMWQYGEGPRGFNRAWVCEDAEKIVGFAGLVRHRWYIHGRQQDCYMPNDAMTHPDYRHQGMHAAVFTKMMEYIRSTDAPMCYVLPNEKSIKEVENQGWTKAFPIPHVVREIQPAEGRSSKVAAGVDEITVFDSRADRLSESLKDRFHFCLVRDSNYLNWRYVRKPDDKYRIFCVCRGDDLLGYMVFKLYREGSDTARSHIVDLLVRPEEEEAVESLVGMAVNLSVETKSRTLSCWMLPQSPWHNYLMANGFETQRTSRHMCAYVNSPAVIKAEVSEPTNWYLTMGDSDVF
jgi:lipopolysaccharide/colanic/teichoic acid biosynthesis glycosyltransferase/GNAT superfamily N-acetyltransferase